jgi:hypothetical protein
MLYLLKSDSRRIVMFVRCKNRKKELMLAFTSELVRLLMLQVAPVVVLSGRRLLQVAILQSISGVTLCL